MNLLSRYREAYEDANGVSLTGAVEHDGKIIIHSRTGGPQRVMVADEVEAAIASLGKYAERRRAMVRSVFA